MSFSLKHPLAPALHHFHVRIICGLARYHHNFCAQNARGTARQVQSPITNSCTVRRATSQSEKSGEEKSPVKSVAAVQLAAKLSKASEDGESLDFSHV